MQIDVSPFWLVFGLLGNAAFATRWLLQWYASERAARSVMPVGFWYLSVAGAVILLTYAIHRQDPVFILASLPNTLVYVRNIALNRRRDATPGTQGGSGG